MVYYASTATIKRELYTTIKNIWQKILEKAMDAETLAVFTKFLNTPKVKVDFEYRLYYNKQNGDPLFYSMEDNASGDFIVVTHEQYTEGRYDIRILNGKIENVGQN